MGFDRVRAAGAFFGLYSATLPTLSDGDIGAIAIDSSGRMLEGDPNSTATIHASGNEAATVNGVDITNLYGRAGVFVLDITAVTGTPTLDVKMQAKDSLSGKYVDVPNVVFAQKSGTGTTMLQVVPGIAASANIAVSSQIPYIYRFVYTVGGSGGPSFTFTLSVQYYR